jgi:hypothetical protein
LATSPVSTSPHEQGAAAVPLSLASAREIKIDEGA